MIANEMDKRISQFLRGQTVLTLATCNNNVPYCSSCFYEFMEIEACLVFKSSTDTRHIEEGSKHPYVAGTVMPDKLDVTHIQGVQFSGRLVKPDDGLLGAARSSYFRRYPFALAMKGELWVIELNYIKFTDNKLGFGKKLTWERAVTPN